MGERSWNRRELGRAVAPALVAIPALAARVGGHEPTPRSRDGLWPEARVASDFYRKHLPAGHRLAAPTLSAADRDGMATRRATFAVLQGDAPVGHLELDATFGAGQARPLRQAILVAGEWYGHSIANAFRAGLFA